MKRLSLYLLAFTLFSFAVSASADTLGQSQKFFISPQYDAQSRPLVDVTLRYVSERAYFYVADDYWYNTSETVRNQMLTQIGSLADEFDKRIYPTEIQFFGSEPNPGIDNDPHVVILLTPLIENAGGYFDTTNQYPNTEVPNSNQREIVYLNINELANQNKMFAFLAHEFQHLIFFNQKEKMRNVSDDIWLNELCSEYAPTLLGYNNVYEGSHLQRRARALLNDPSDSLTEWKNLPADYGQIGLFGEYIAEHWSPQVIADTLKNNLVGFSSLAESLAKNGFGETFLDVFRDWLVANFLNDGSINKKFSYTKSDLGSFHVIPTRTISNLDENAVFTISDSIKDWQGRWYDFAQLTLGQKNILKITFDSPSLASFYVSYLIFKPNGQYQVYEFKPMPNSSELYIPDIGSDVSRVVIMPIKKDKLSSFSANETPVQLTLSFERVTSVSSVLSPLSPISTSVPAIPTTHYQLLTTNYPDGSLIRARGDYKVYIIKDKWRRHIINSRIFNFYPGLGFNRVTEVDPSVLNQYQESNLIRYVADQKVYAVNETGARQWLNMSGEQFTTSGRAWDSIFEINLKELTFYKIGFNIIR